MNTLNSSNEPGLLAAIKVNMATGVIEYPNLPGFKLDKERLYSTFELFLPHSATPEMALRLAIHGQLTAHKGACELFPELAKGS